MASPIGNDGDLVDRLQQRFLDPGVLEERQRAVNERINAIYQKAQERLGEIIDQNSTLPVTVSSVQVLNASHTRRPFLQKVLEPLVNFGQDRPTTLSELLREVSETTDKLHRFDIFEKPISVFFDKPSQTDASTTPTDLDVYLSVKEKSRILFKTGTDLGNAEGSAYANLMWRNILGGAESLNLNASVGTRTRSAYHAIFETPVLSDPDFRWEIGAAASDTQKTWASHEEVLKGGWTKLRWQGSNGHRHEFGYSGFWRQITGLANTASQSIRENAGDSVKSSVSHCWVNDRRDNPMLPSRGLYTKIFNELAGWGPLKGDVSFWKSEIEAQGAFPIPIPMLSRPSGVTLTVGFRGGFLYPLGLDSDLRPQSSRINDRFQLGGPTDVRGFRLSGLGPRDGLDALGGDVYSAGSLNLLCPLPRVGAEKPFRLQAFLNMGRLLALQTPQGDAPKNFREARESLAATVSELKNGLPSTAAGIGLVYAHPAARFELNFSLPLVIRRGEEGRKGLQLGIGFNLM
ncbi:hypothetical protein VTO42DRAFT_2573 [Malbranchea cinnamomea]